MPPIAELIALETAISDGGRETLVKYQLGIPDSPLLLAGLLDDPGQRGMLTDIFTEYASVAADSGLPYVVGTPTRHAAPDYLQAAGREPGDLTRINSDAVAFTREAVAAAGVSEWWLGGVMGPRGDAYGGAGSEVAQAARYHSAQAEALANAGVDFLTAMPLPNADEAVGLCLAMAATGKPYVPGFLVGADGRLPDGTWLGPAIARCFDEVTQLPLHVAIVCVHPDNFVSARMAASKHDPGTNAALARIARLKANGSTLSPGELARATGLVSDSPEQWADAMMRARDEADLQIVGGCCGTSPAHLRALAERLTADDGNG